MPENLICQRSVYEVARVHCLLNQFQLKLLLTLESEQENGVEISLIFITFQQLHHTSMSSRIMLNNS